MPTDTKGNVKSPQPDSTGLPNTPPSDDTSYLSRSGLAELLSRAATPEPESKGPTEEPPAAPAEPPEPAEGTTEISAPTSEEAPGAGDQPAETESDLSQPDDSPPSPPEPEEEDKGDKGDPPGVQKRIDQFRHKLGDAEREVARLKAEVEELKAKPAAAAEPGPVAPRLLDAEELRMATREGDLRKALKTIRENPDGLEVNGRQWSAEDLATEREEYEAELASIKVEARQYAARKAEQKKVLDADAVKRHPWIEDKTDKRAQLLGQMMGYQPSLRNEPAMLSILADALAYRWEQAEAAKKAKQAPKPKPPPPAPAKVAAAPAKADTRRSETEAASKRLVETGSRDALAALLKARGGR